MLWGVLIVNESICFFCEETAEYISVEAYSIEEKGSLDNVSVCKMHFDFTVGVS